MRDMRLCVDAVAYLTEEPSPPGTPSSLGVICINPRKGGIGILIENGDLPFN